jgi:hypothetical protein
MGTRAHDGSCVLSNPRVLSVQARNLEKYFKHPEVMFASLDETDERYRTFKKAIQHGRTAR